MLFRWHEMIVSGRKSYYEALEAANKPNEITNWLAWFAGITIEVQRSTIALVEFFIDKAKLLDRLQDELNEPDDDRYSARLASGKTELPGFGCVTISRWQTFIE